MRFNIVFQLSIILMELFFDYGILLRFKSMQKIHISIENKYYVVMIVMICSHNVLVSISIYISKAFMHCFSFEVP